MSRRDVTLHELTTLSLTRSIALITVYWYRVPCCLLAWYSRVFTVGERLGKDNVLLVEYRIECMMRCRYQYYQYYHESLSLSVTTNHLHQSSISSSIINHLFFHSPVASLVYTHRVVWRAAFQDPTRDLRRAKIGPPPLSHQWRASHTSERTVQTKYRKSKQKTSVLISTHKLNDTWLNTTV